MPRLVWGKLIDVVLVSLKLQVPAMGSGSSALITAGHCTAGRFMVAQHFVYADRGTVDVTRPRPAGHNGVDVPYRPRGGRSPRGRARSSRGRSSVRTGGRSSV